MCVKYGQPGARPRVVHGLRAAQPGVGMPSWQSRPRGSGGQRVVGRTQSSKASATMHAMPSSYRDHRDARDSGRRRLTAARFKRTPDTTRRSLAVTAPACAASLRGVQPLRYAPPQAPRRLPTAIPGRLRQASRSDRTRSASCLALACAGCARAQALPAGGHRMQKAHTMPACGFDHRGFPNPVRAKAPRFVSSSPRALTGLSAGK